jgi:hypothetical protein
MKSRTLTQSAGKRSRSRRGFRPALQTLEGRSVPSATLFVFHVDPMHSQLTASGSIQAGMLGQLDVQAQKAGSLTTPISGTIQASVDLTAHQLRFLADGTSLIAASDHSVSPGVNGAAGSAPADIGGFVAGSAPVPFRVDLALRDGIGTLSTARPLSLRGGNDLTFPSTETVGLRSAFLDARPSGAATAFFSPGRINLAGKHGGDHAAMPGQLLSLGDGAFRIIVPIHVRLSATLHGTTTTLAFDGTITGTSNFAPVITAPTTQHTPANMDLIFLKAHHNGLAVADKDGDRQTVQLTAGHGTLMLGRHTGLSVRGDETGQVTVSGSIAQINAALNGLTFMPAKGFQGNATIKVTDQDGHGGMADTTIKVVVTPAVMPARKLPGGYLGAADGTFAP